MRRSGRSNVVRWLTSKAFGVRSLAAVKPTAFRFCAIRLAMPFGRLSDRLDAKNAQIVSDRVLSRPGWSDVVFAFYDDAPDFTARWSWHLLLPSCPGGENVRQRDDRNRVAGPHLLLIRRSGFDRESPGMPRHE